MLAATDLSRWEQQQLALAAVIQCAALVRSLANEGRVLSWNLAACVNPLIQLDAESINEIYPDLMNLIRGFNVSQRFFTYRNLSQNRDLFRYTFGILLLRHKLMSEGNMLETLRERLRYVDPLPTDYKDPDCEEFSDEEADRNDARHERTLLQLGSLYLDTISTLNYRIVVRGQLEYLNEEKTANTIRALLLAGIRSAVLWHQLGGRAWQLVVYRNRCKATMDDLRKRVMATVQIVL